jgi:uncharacterized membrane protein YidH (DUF202 family)
MMVVRVRRCPVRIILAGSGGGAGPASSEAYGDFALDGIELVVLGVAVNLAAAVMHWHTVRLLEQGQPIRFRPISLGLAVALLLGVLGLLMAVYLLVGLDHSSQ